MIYSFSKLQDFQKCPNCFHAKHVLGYEDPQKSIDMEWGTVMHKVIEDYLLEDVDPVPAFTLQWSLLVNSTPLSRGRYSPEELSIIANTILKKFKAKRKNFGTDMMLETELKFTVSGVDFKGKVDYMGMYNDEPTLLDFKTTATRYDITSAQLSNQLALYAYGAKDVLDYHPKLVAFFPMVKSTESIQNLVTANVTNSWLTKRLDEVMMCVEMVEYAIAKNRWPSNRANCFYCKTREHGIRELGKLKETT